LILKDFEKNAHCVGRRSLETLGFSFEKTVIVMRILKTNLAVSDTERIDSETGFWKVSIGNGLFDLTIIKTNTGCGVPDLFCSQTLGHHFLFTSINSYNSPSLI